MTELQIKYRLDKHGNNHSGYAVYPCFNGVSLVLPSFLTFRYIKNFIQKLTKQGLCPVHY